MKLTTQQKELLISVLENIIEKLSMDDSMEYGEDLNIILENVNKLEVA